MRMRHTLVFFVLTMVVLAASGLFAAAVWGQAPAGITVEAVATAVEDAEAPPAPPAIEPEEAQATIPGTEEVGEEPEETEQELSLEEALEEPAPSLFEVELPLFGQKIFARSLTEALPVQAGPVPPSYVLGSGDLLRVQLWTGQVQQVAADVTVDNTGAIYLENLGRIPVQGMTLGGLRGLLQQRYGQIFEEFSLEVTIAEMRLVEVFVIGEVREPGKFYLPGNATVFTALYAAGGPTENGSLRSIRLSRADEALQTIDLYDYLLAGRRVVDVPLEPGDTVFVPLVGAQVGVAGFVKRPARYELQGEQNLAAVLAMSGGLQARAYALRVQVRRFSDRQTLQTLDIDLSQPSAAQEFIIRDGDRVVVEQITEELENAVYLQGSVYRPGTYELHLGLTLGLLLREAQGLHPKAYGEWGVLHRLNPRSARYEALSINPLLAQQGVAAYDVPLQARDRVFILSREEVQGKLRVTVAGQVREPGEVTYIPRMSIKDAVMQAGGLLPEAFTGQAQLVRVAPDMSKQVIAVNLQLAMGGDPQHNLALQPYDEITVYNRGEIGPLAAVTIDGLVKNPGEYQRYGGMKVSDLIAAAGGLLPGASGMVKLTHGRYTDIPQTETLGCETDEVMPVVVPNLVLRDDDHVAVMGRGGFVQKPSVIAIAGQVREPGPYVLKHPSAHPEGVWDMLEQAGGLRPEAYGPGIVVYRQLEGLLTPEQVEEYEHVVSGLDEQHRELKTETFIVEGSSEEEAVRQVTRGLAAAFAAQGSVTLIVPPRELLDQGFAQALPLDWAELEASRGARGDVPLQDGDCIYVPAKPTVIMVAGAVHNPSPMRYEPGLTVAEVIRRAGGLGRDAVPGEALLIRSNGQVVSAASGEKLQPGDVVVVPTDYMIRKIKTESIFERTLSLVANLVTSFLWAFR